MQKTIIALALAAGFAAPAMSQTAAPASEHTLTGNIGLFSSYRFRGIDQTFGRPALQGGIDYSHASGFYAGNWNSNVNEGAGYPRGNLEMDFYGGYKTTFGDLGLDVGGLYYYYPGTDGKLIGNPKYAGKTGSGAVDNGELYAALSWKFLSFKYSHAVTNYFDAPKTKGTGYFDISANYDLGNGWGVNGHVGYLNLKDFRGASGDDGKYTDWKVGVTKDLSGWVLAASYIGTNAAGNCGKGDPYCFGNSFFAPSKFKDAGRDTAVLSVSKTF